MTTSAPFENESADSNREEVKEEVVSSDSNQTSIEIQISVTVTSGLVGPII